MYRLTTTAPVLVWTSTLCQPRFCPARLASLRRFLPEIGGRPRPRFGPGGRTGGRSYRAASLRSRATTTKPAVCAGLSNSRWAEPPSTAIPGGSPCSGSWESSQATDSAAISTWVRKGSFAAGGSFGRSLLRT